MRLVNSNSQFQVLRNVKIGDGVRLCNFINLYDCEIGEGTLVGTFVEIQAGSKIGRNCRIQSHTFICSGVTIGDEVFVGHGVMFINDNFPSATTEHSRSWAIAPVQVGDRSSIGTGAIILGGVTIGQNVLIAAGAVVVHDVPDNQTVIGVPARRVSGGEPR